MSIKITKVAIGFSVEFPFELKDNFRSVFKTSKWDSAGRHWIVGPRSGSRLEAWAAEARSAAEAIIARDEAELVGQELETVRAELARIQAAAHIAAARHVEAQAARVEIEAIRTQIAAEAAKRDTAKAAESVERAAAETQAYSVISASALDRALRAMQHACVSWPKSSARDKFDSAQSELLEMLRVLRTAGLESPEIKDAVGRSWNRIGKDGRFFASRPTFRVKSNCAGEA